MNVVPHSVPQDSNTIKTTLPYNRKYVLFAYTETQAGFLFRQTNSPSERS